MEFSEENEKEHVPDDPDLEPSSSESSSNKNKSNKNKMCQIDKKDGQSDPSSSNDSDFSNGIDYRRKQHKKKSYQKKDTIKLCAHLMAKLLMTAYKSNIIRFIMDEDPIQRRIYFSHLQNHWR